VCEQTQKSCPHLYPFALNCLAWPFEDPAAFKGTDVQRLQKFRDVRDEIETRILNWLRETKS
jgi:arsenate reductase